MYCNHNNITMWQYHCLHSPLSILRGPPLVQNTWTMFGPKSEVNTMNTKTRVTLLYPQFLSWMANPSGGWQWYTSCGAWLACGRLFTANAATSHCVSCRATLHMFKSSGKNTTQRGFPYPNSSCLTDCAAFPTRVCLVRTGQPPRPLTSEPTPRGARHPRQLGSRMSPEDVSIASLFSVW